MKPAEEIAQDLHEHYCVEHEDDCSMQEAIAKAINEARAEAYEDVYQELRLRHWGSVALDFIQVKAQALREGK